MWARYNPIIAHQFFTNIHQSVPTLCQTKNRKKYHRSRWTSKDFFWIKKKIWSIGHIATSRMENWAYSLALLLGGFLCPFTSFATQFFFLFNFDGYLCSLYNLWDYFECFLGFIGKAVSVPIRVCAIKRCALKQTLITSTFLLLYGTLEMFYFALK